MPNTIYQNNMSKAQTSVKVGSSSNLGPITITVGPGGSGGSGASTISVSNPVLMGGAVIGPSSNGTGNWTQTVTPGKIHVKVDAVFDSNITWQGRDMREWFETVESRLGMLKPNPELEQGWDELAQLRHQYIELERKLLEQQRVFDILKQE